MREMGGPGDDVSTTAKALFFLLSAALVLGLWQAAVWGGASRFVLPAPLDVLRAFREFRGAIVDAIWITFLEVVLGFAAAAVGGVLLAVAITYSRRLAALIYPPLLLLNALPKIAIAPLLLIWIGFGMTMKVFVAFLIAFFPVVIATTTGLRSVDPDLHDLARSLRSPRLFTFWKIDLPSALPSVFAGFKVAITLAVTGALVGEFISADGGLGFLIRTAANQHLTALAFAVVVAVAALSMALFAAIVLIERVLIPWSRGLPER